MTTKRTMDLVQSLEDRHLSARQRRVFEMMARGNSVHEISETLHITSKTVYEHIQRVKEKTGLDSLFQLGVWYGRWR